MSKNKQGIFSNLNNIFFICFLVLNLLIFFISAIYFYKTSKLFEIRRKKINKEMFLINDSFLIRKEGFYTDKIYLKKEKMLNKNWSNNSEGVIFYERN